MKKIAACVPLLFAVLQSATLSNVRADDEVALPPRTIDFSPRAWREGELERFLKLGRTFGQEKPLAKGAEFAIVGTTAPAAVRAGYEALDRGGSAADAVLATALAQIALSAGSWNSYAGILSLVYFDAETGEIHALDAGFDAPLGESDPSTIPGAGTADGRTALTPGFMAGLQAAHERFGRVPFTSLFQPAIYFAEEGFELDPMMAGLIAWRRPVLERLPETKAVFTNGEGEWYEAGDVFRQPALARTLRGVADEGVEYMYDGPWGEALVKAVQAEGGTLALEDLRRYKPTWSAPLHATYKGADLYAPGAAQQGGMELLEALKLVERAGERVEAPIDTSAESLYWLIQIARMPKLLTLMPPEQLEPLLGTGTLEPAARVSDAHAARVWEFLLALAQQQKAQADEGIEPGELESGGHSDAVVAIDRFGNVAALTHSINTMIWGTTGIFVQGVSIPDSANFQQNRLAAAGPGGRIPNEMNPVIVRRDDETILASSSIGVALHEASLQALVNVLDRGMNPKQAVEAPMFLGLYWVGADGDPDAWRRQVVPAWPFEEALLDEVEALGQRLHRIEPAALASHNGFWIGITREPKSGGLAGGVGPELNGHALAK